MARHRRVSDPGFGHRHQRAWQSGCLPPPVPTPTLQRSWFGLAHRNASQQKWQDSRQTINYKKCQKWFATNKLTFTITNSLFIVHLQTSQLKGQRTKMPPWRLCYVWTARWRTVHGIWRSGYMWRELKRWPSKSFQSLRETTKSSGAGRIGSCRQTRFCCRWCWEVDDL